MQELLEVITLAYKKLSAQNIVLFLLFFNLPIVIPVGLEDFILQRCIELILILHPTWFDSVKSFLIIPTSAR